MERNLLGRPISDVEQIRLEFRTALAGIREEFDDHLDSINENTSEIQGNFEYLQRLESKIDKLSEKLENVQQWLSRSGMPTPADEQQEISLSKQEKDVFFAVYTASGYISYEDIAQQLHISDFLVRSYVTNLIEKGVPVTKHYIRNRAYISLDPRFRELQTKRNVLGISQTTMANF